MNQFFIKNEILISGVAAPFTGEFKNIARSRDMLITVHTDGTGSVNLYYQSPFSKDEAVLFYSFNGLQSGYAEPAYLTSPMHAIRASCAGAGNFSVAVTCQN